MVLIIFKKHQGAEARPKGRTENIEFTLPPKPKVRVISGIHIHLVVTAGKVKRKFEVI
jgi:hypothetical protein